LSKAYDEELEEFLERKPRELTVVTMPDFFLDRLVNLHRNPLAFQKDLVSVAERKGGSIDNIEQSEFRGGNAVNTASALSSLGVNVVPIVCTNRIGLQLIRLYLRPGKTDLSHVKLFDTASITTALEFEVGEGKTNVMLRDVGALAGFGTQHLNNDDFEAIENADYVCVFNWAGTRKFGTKLAKNVLHRVKTSGRGKTYVDTADPTPNKDEIPNLMRYVLKQNDLDILSVNENEAICYASQTKKQAKTTRQQVSPAAKKAARVLAAEVHARVALHTAGFSGTFKGTKEIIVPAFNVPVLRATGAGDAWNAGNILGDANQLSDGCRLALANAAAAFYISSRDGTHPTLKQLASFCARMRRKTG
jgi:sugar/nucleoside kinase (ribokinase family)